MIVWVIAAVVFGVIMVFRYAAAHYRIIFLEKYVKNLQAEIEGLQANEFLRSKEDIDYMLRTIEKKH